MAAPAATSDVNVTGYERHDLKPTEIRAAFGRVVDTADLVGTDISEMLAIHRDTLKVEGGDPNYEYGWMDLRDPACQVKLRKGFWELCTLDTDPDIIAPGASVDPAKTSERTYRVNELALVRMPKERYVRLRKAESALAARAELTAQNSFQGNVASVEGQFGQSAGSYFQEKSEARTVVERPSSDDEVTRKALANR